MNKIKIVTTVYAIILGLRERIKLVDLAILQLVAKGFFHVKLSKERRKIHDINLENLS